MTRTIDARKLDCPQPVLLAKQALAETDEIVVIVDNEVARANVSRLGESEGCAVSVQARDSDLYLTLKRTAPRFDREKQTGTDGIVLFVASDILGRGENLPLGSLLMQSFLHTLGSLKTRPETIIFINNGVKLVTGDSPVLGELQQLAGQGMAIIACGTCLSRLELTAQVAVGQVSNMYVIAETLLKAQKIVSL